MFVDCIPFICIAGIIWVTIWYFKSEAREHSDKDEVGIGGDDDFIWLPPPSDNNDNNDDMGDWQTTNLLNQQGDNMLKGGAE